MKYITALLLWWQTQQTMGLPTQVSIRVSIARFTSISPEASASIEFADTTRSVLLVVQAYPCRRGNPSPCVVDLTVPRADNNLRVLGELIRSGVSERYGVSMERVFPLRSRRD